MTQENIKIVWATESPIESVDGHLTSDRASIRYRVLMPAERLGASGFASDFVTISEGMDYDAFLAAVPGLGDVVVISKSFKSETLAIARQLKQADTKVVVDLCDYRPDNAAVMRQTAALVELADLVTASTKTVALAVTALAGCEATVIEDPYEGPAGAPRFAAPGERLTLLWFGHPTNIEALFPLMAGVLQMPRGPADPAIDFHVVTTPIPSLIEALETLSGMGGQACTFRLTAWSPAANWQALAACDAVMLPSLATDYFRAKGANRLIEALRAGRFAIAEPIPSYQDFAGHAWVDADLLAGLRWALANPADAQARIEAGQAYVNQHYSPESIATKWAAALRTLA